MVERATAGSDVGDASDHSVRLGALPKPFWLRNSSLLDNTWEVRSDDATLKRNATIFIEFDVVIDVGAVRMSDPAYESDLITAKLMLYYALQPLPLGGVAKSGAYAKLLLSNYLRIVRWRISRGIPNNRSLTPEWIEEFLATIRKEGPRGVVPYTERARAYLAKLEKEGRKLPRSVGSRVEMVSMDRIAHELGANSGISLTEEARQLIQAAAERENLPGSWDPGAKRPGHGKSLSLMSSFLRPLDLLYRYRRHLDHDAVLFNPCPKGRSGSQLAKSLSSSDPGRTPSIPPAQACYLIDRALVWVIEYAPDLRRVASLLSQKSATTVSNNDRYRYYRQVAQQFVPTCRDPHVAGSPWPTREADPVGRRRSDRPSLRQIFFELLPSACLVVIAAFSARRISELESLRSGCLSVENGELWLETWISKSVRDVSKIPVPEVVKAAVETLEALSEARRARLGQPWIMEFDDPIPGPARAFHVKKSLAAFSAYVQVPCLPDGDAWRFTPHQFRRFFAIIYYHHYRFPHLGALSNFLRHFNPDMTRIYISEVSSGGFLELAEERAAEYRRRAAASEESRLADFNAEGLNFRTERFLAIATGRERATGFGGERLTSELMGLYSRFLDTVEIGAAGEGLPFHKVVEAFASLQRLEPNPLGHSYCRCRADSGDLAAAACLDGQKERIGPDLSNAADATCSSCPHNVQLPENEAYWRKIVEEASVQSACALTPALAALAEARAAMASRHCERCFGNAR